MTLRQSLTLCALLVPLASCGTVNEAPSCAGWQPVQMAPTTVDYMAQSDPQALRAVIGHMRFGRAQGCWE
jgi:hypothetical protein